MSNKKHAWKPPVYLALTLLIAGSGVMAPLWALTRAHQDIPGWASFSATTVGDTILLPLLAGCLFAVFRDLPRSGRTAEVRVTLLGAILGATGGAAVQLSWIFDDKPRLTWVLPRPHEFSAGGWYQAAFLCTTTGVLLALAFGAAFRSRMAAKIGKADHIDQAASSPLLLTIIACTWAFCLLIIHDGGAGASSLLTVAASLIPGVLLIALCIYAAGAHYKRILPIIVWSLALALLVALTAVTWPRSLMSMLGAAVAIGLTGGIYFRNSSWPHRITELCLIAFALVALLVLPLGSADSIGRNLLLALCTGPITWAVTAIGPVKALYRAPCSSQEAIMTGVFSLSVPVAGWLLQHGDAGAAAGSFAVLVAATIFGALLVPGYRPDMDELMREEAAQPGVTSDPAISARARSVVLRGASWGVAAVCGLLGIVIAAGPSMGFVYGTGLPEMRSWAAPGALLAAITSCLVSLAVRKSPLAPAVPAMGGLAVLALVLVGFISAPHHPWWSAWAAVAAALVSAWCMESIVANAAMRPRWVVRRSWRHVTAAPTALAAGAVVLFTCTDGMVNSKGRPAESFASLGIFALGTLTSFLLIIAVAWVLDPHAASCIGAGGVRANAAAEPENWARYRLRSWLPVDFGLVQGLTIIGIWLPSLALAHIGLARHAGVFNSAIMACTGILFFTPVFVWSLRNSVRHIDEQSMKAQRLSRAIFFGTLPYVSLIDEKETVKRFLRSGDGPASQQEWANAVAVNQLHLSVISMMIGVVSIIGSLGVFSSIASDAAAKGGLALNSTSLRGGSGQDR